MSKFFEIAGRQINKDQLPYCIAEVGINHNGDIQLAKKMIEAAKRSGADAVKFQTFKAHELCGNKEQFFTYYSQGKKITESMLEMFSRFELSDDSWLELKEYCDKVGITFFSTPQNLNDLELLVKVGVPAIKVGSDDFSNLPLLESYSKFNLPIILSCGMSDLADVHNALEATNWFKNRNISILLCTSSYPTESTDVNLSKLITIQNAFPGLNVGFSDHTRGFLAASIAVGLGASIFEKHFTLDNNYPGPDHWFSEDENGLKLWISNIKEAHTMLGSPYVMPTEAEKEMRVLARRSLIVIKDIKKGEIITSSNLAPRRPGDGLSPSLLKSLIGLKASRDLAVGEKISMGDFINDT
jgi:N,N'-diacetyllegionaminate synthase